MKLNAELIDITRDLCPLRFIFLQLMLKIGNPSGVFGDDLNRRGGDANRLPASLATNR